MKSIIKVWLVAIVMFVCSQTAAQNVSTVTTASYPEIAMDVQSIAGYYQDFNFYNNSEIRKLENEVERHGNLYRWDQRGNKKYTSIKYQNLTESEKKRFQKFGK